LPPALRGYRERAREALGAGTFDALFGLRGDGNWDGNFANVDGFAARPLKPSIMRDVSDPQTEVAVLGGSCALPLVVAPMGYGNRFHADGEAGMIAAAGEAGIPYCASMAASETIESLVSSSEGPIWFQVWMLRDRDAMARLLERAAEAGAQAIILASIHHALYRPRPAFEAAAAPPPGRGTGIPNLGGLGFDPVPTPAEFHGCLDMSLNWRDLEWLRSSTSLPLVLKGVQVAADARRAIDLGVGGIIVSNHGGPGLPTPRATLDCLLEVSAAVDGSSTELLLDGGVRSGADVLKALAAGARSVLIGRAPFWGLAADGRAGAADVLSILDRELRTAMAYAGVTSVSEVPAALI